MVVFLYFGISLKLINTLFLNVNALISMRRQAPLRKPKSRIYIYNFIMSKYNNTTLLRFLLFKNVSRVFGKCLGA